MPTEMDSSLRSKLQVDSDKLKSMPTCHCSLATSTRERMSVFTCATDDCPLCAHAQQRDGILLSDAQSFDHCTIAWIADATKIIEQPSASSNQEKQAAP